QIQPISATEGMASNSGLGSFTVSQQSEIAAPIPLSPVNATFVEEVIKKNGLNFAWKQDKEISGVQFQLASDAGFQNTIASTRVSGNVYAFRGELRPGTYYWRLSGAGFPASRVVSFSVADKERLEAVVPAPGQTVTSLARNVDIRFAWKGGAGNYRILVSQSQDLNNAKVASTTARSLTVQGLEGGTYFWKVQKLGSEGEVLGESALLNFKIERKLDKPVLIAPAPGSVVDMTDLDRLIFRWRPVEGARSYTLKVFQIDGTGQKLILTRQVAGAAFEFTDLKLLDESLFRYTVEANAPGLEGEAAQATFRISLQLEKKPEFITPEVIFK
ncbi:MAG: hypothetical protein KDK25_00590, partial [Leptospiraceae bacterium]|nr:hypothetical protein [Leptospiraceae bacterium]